MACRLFAWMRSHPSARRRAGRSSALLLTAVVTGWWLCLGVAIVMLLPISAVSAPKGAYKPSPGATAHIVQPGLKAWPIPVARIAFDDFYRGTAQTDESAIEAAFTESEWIEVEDRTSVRVTVVDGDAIEIELLDGSNAGRRGWVKPRHLGP